MDTSDAMDDPDQDSDGHMLEPGSEPEETKDRPPQVFRFLWPVLAALTLVMVMVVTCEWILWLRRRAAAARVGGRYAAAWREQQERDIREAELDQGLTETVRVAGRVLTVRHIPRDGDALFSALAYLVFGLRPGSPEHARISQAMRLKAVDHIKKHTTWFYAGLLEAAEKHGQRYDGAGSDDDKVRRYLSDLERPGFPAGPEAIPALADVYWVDVAVYSEDEEGGDVYNVIASTPRYPLEDPMVAGATAALLHRPVEGGRSHFDAVTRARRV